MLPVLGPSTLRDTAGSFVNVMGGDPWYNASVHGNNEFLGEGLYITSKALSGIDFRSDNIESFENLEKNSIDFYASVRSLYSQDRENKIKNIICGNFGNPACLVNPSDNNIVIVELSSYQLLSIPSLKIDFGIIINISNDHLDYHGNFDAYLNAKLRLIEAIKDNGCLVVNHKDVFLKNKIKRKLRNINNVNVLNTCGKEIKCDNLLGEHNKILFVDFVIIYKKD